MHVAVYSKFIFSLYSKRENSLSQKSVKRDEYEFSLWTYIFAIITFQWDYEFVPREQIWRCENEIDGSDFVVNLEQFSN